MPLTVARFFGRLLSSLPVSLARLRVNMSVDLAAADEGEAWTRAEETDAEETRMSERMQRGKTVLLTGEWLCPSLPASPSVCLCVPRTLVRSCLQFFDHLLTQLFYLLL
jgi:hypothetical protein